MKKHNFLFLFAAIFLASCTTTNSISSPLIPSSESGEISSISSEDLSSINSVTSSSSEHSSQSEEISSSVHVHVPVTDPALEPTCTRIGLTEGSHCEICGEVLVPQLEVPKQHKYVVKDIFLDERGEKREGVVECEKCGARETRTLNPKDVNMPIIEINGDLSKISKDKKVNIEASYHALNEDESFSAKATLKIQGATSAGFPKKNYNIQFLKDDGSKKKVTLKEEWGKQSKYTLKANWVDYSHARNVVSGQLYSQIIHSVDLDDEVGKLPNGGVVDGFPTIVYLNGKYNGLYTLNIPKDNWMFGMKDESLHQAILSTNDHGESCCLREQVASDLSNGWEFEYCSTEDSEEGTAWAIESMNNLITWVNRANERTFKIQIHEKVNYQRTLDSLIYTWFINAADNFGKNILWATYDGVIWFPSVYDMDGTWGLAWDGSYYKFNDASPTLMGQQWNEHQIWKLMYKYLKSDIKERYFELRKGVLSQINIEKTFNSFFSSIPEAIKTVELQRWPDIPDPQNNTKDQIFRYAKDRGNYFDTEISKW